MAKAKKNNKNKNQQDPFAEREAATYKNPIASREMILNLLEEIDTAVTRQDIADALELVTPEQLEALRRRLRAMVRDGQLVCNKQGMYCLVPTLDYIEGTVKIFKNGRGVVDADDDSHEIGISDNQLKSVFPGDKVKVKIIGIGERGKLKGSISEVIARSTKSVQGKFYCESQVGYVVPSDNTIKQNIMIMPDHYNNATSGQNVMVDIILQPTLRTQAVGTIREILNDGVTLTSAVDLAIREQELPNIWPGAVLRETDKLADEVPEKDKKDRVDLRHLPFVTIDGSDARDFDDAVYTESKKSGDWKLYVAIADVSYYVRPGTSLDDEAQQRGTSVYFPNKVLPMLPEKISNGLCSLKPKVDRLCMVCEMAVSKKGKLSSYRFYPAVMHSHARLTYTQVAKVLDGDTGALPKDEQALLPNLQDLHALYKILIKQRSVRGALEFDTVETKLVLNSTGQVDKIVPVTRNDAHCLIEECMLLANVATARFLQENEADGLFRIHAVPKAEKIDELRKFLNLTGIGLGGNDKPEVHDFAHALQQAKTRPDFSVIQMVILRSMNQAMYSPDNVGHFGLAYDEYTHFTSPIRRYPDLMVHRIIRHLLRDKSGAAHMYPIEKLRDLCEHTSFTERRADTASRDVEGALKCAYMHDRLGETFAGVISGVNNFGFFVQLDGLYVDGLVHVSSLYDDFYEFDPVSYSLTGERTNKVYKMGDRLQVKLTRADVESGKIDFELIDLAPRRGRKWR